MDNYKRYSLIIRIIEKLVKKESWCGDTHIQKAIYLLQEITNVNPEYRFILYKHGPYSFDLSDDLRSMRADGYLDLEPTYPYGGCYTIRKRGNYLREYYRDYLNKNEDQIDLITETIGNLTVVNLEKLSTALYVTKEKRDSSVVRRAAYLNRLKPHVKVKEAERFIKKVDTLLRR